MITTKRKVYFQRSSKNRRVISTTQPARQAAPAGRVQRVSKLVALALHFDRLIREGKVRDQSELARLCRVTQPRMSQLMNLTHLAPDIVEAVLHLPLRTGGRDAVHERMLRPLTAAADWAVQRRMWSAIHVASRGGPAAGRAVEE
jgi:hypothetical protein